jgi:hypothetical protein
VFQIVEAILNENGDRSNKDGRTRDSKEETSARVIANIVATAAAAPVTDIRSQAMYVIFFK